MTNRIHFVRHTVYTSNNNKLTAAYTAASDLFDPKIDLFDPKIDLIDKLFD